MSKNPMSQKSGDGPPPAKKNAAPVAPTSSHNAPVFEVRELELCLALRLNKDELRARRYHFLVQGTHWDFVNKRVLLSRIGAEILRGTKDAVLPPEARKNARAEDCEAARAPIALLLEKNPPPAPFEGKLLAWASPVRNEKLLVAYVPGTDPMNPLNLVSVSVRSNRNFLRGMVLPATAAGEGHYNLVGPCPRFRGRW